MDTVLDQMNPQGADMPPFGAQGPMNQGNPGAASGGDQSFDFSSGFDVTE